MVGKTELLYQMAKGDRNVMGKQLCALLANDFSTPQGRTTAHKNAFALMRLKRYRHAAATFLCAKPPMLKEVRWKLDK